MASEPQERRKTIQHYSYYLNDSIGKGFSSTVYKGKNDLNGGSVAIKVIDLRKLSQSTMRQLLQSQIQIVKRLDHNNILKCENVFITVNNCYIITQLCQGGDLASQIKKKGRLRGVQALKIMLEIARGIAHLAKLNIIHRDIKPANILLHQGNVKIADFGFAKYQQTQGKKQKYSVGSPLYMSPEALFSNYYSKQNDIWSLGVVFYQILQGRPPWDPKNEKQLKQILKQKKQIFFRIAVRDQLETIIRGCLKHQKNERMQMESILKILQEMMKQMQNEDNVAYRQTLTKRTHNTLSCKDLNSNNSNASLLGNITARPPIPKIPKPPTVELTLHKQNSKKEAVLVTEPPLLINRNRSAIQLKQRPATSVPLEEASRHNHKILKSVVNYARLIYKSFPRMDKLEINEPLRLQIQRTMVDLLQFAIFWLKQSIINLQEAEKFGIINFIKFKQTGCYSKTILLINQYFERYTKFVSKTRRFLGQRKNSSVQQNSFSYFSNRFKKLSKDLYVHSHKDDHNIGVDFVIAIGVLTEMLSNFNTAHFAEFSHVEEIVETQPLYITEQADRQELMEKLDSFGRSN